ncbi:MAG: polyprenyl diphosphate synthase [Candidatus Woesearchaeota archaeon]|jgi:undecaprenyl diphosphate synthase|nr:polyprenyl diphosphate synthase [Candidatus Woesearchaeota archaeon]
MINHIGFIMDGNRRYGDKYNLSKKEAYRAGMEQFLNFVKYQVKHNIFETSFYALSTDNYENRGEDLRPIGDLIQNFFKDDDLEEYFIKHKIKLCLRGEIDELEEKDRKERKIKLFVSDLRKRFEKCNAKIGQEFKYRVNIAINYDGQKEILRSFKSIYEKISNGSLDFEKVDEKTIKNNIYYNDSKSPEIIVRPGDSPRISGFMLWDSKYSELYFTKKLWPEMNEEDFVEILDWFKSIKRNFGK